jgi:EAL domain-containing protein (putative c-di-GMP-specific phosphodiesterase class I)
VHSFERLALERREFSLHYQATVDLKTGSVTGMEALLRWMHPDLGMVSPTLFIPLAEETGLIVAIGRWVINATCAQNKAWQEQGLPALCVSVNLSARQFNDDSLLRDVAQALKESDLAPQWLELEVTESMVMYNPDKAVRLLSDLKAMGISIAIDDFGIGYSSLSQLKRFPINTIKIGRSFIKDLMQNKEDAAITGAIIAMGTTLNLNVIAEGVETDAQIGFCRSISATRCRVIISASRFRETSLPNCCVPRKHWCAKMHLNDTMKKNWRQSSAIWQCNGVWWR